MKNNGKNGISEFFSGNGFYAALGVCILGALAAAWFSAERSITSSEEQKNISFPKVSITEEESYDPEDSAFRSRIASKTEQEIEVPEEPPEEKEETFSFVKKGKSFVMPVSGEIIGNHSSGELVKYEALGEWRTHDGIDIAAEPGAEIVSAAEGKITAIRNDPLWGMTVEIDHGNGITGIYCGLSEDVPVKQGDEVKSGEKIGTLGETNLAEIDKNSHLHFSMKENGKFIDPLSKLK